MSWSAFITDAGDALLKQWVTEKTLHISKGAAGTGKVADELLPKLTALPDKRQDASIVSRKETEDGVKIKLQVGAAEAAYDLTQFGVMAHLDGQTEETLLAVFQTDASVPIPSWSDSPDFVYGFFATFALSKEGTLEVHIDTSAIVSNGDLEAAKKELREYSDNGDDSIKKYTDTKAKDTLADAKKYTDEKIVEYPPPQDGFSPTVELNKVGNITTLTITDANGPHSEIINDGKDGQPGAPGAAAGFGQITADVDDGTGTPSVEVSSDGPDSAKNLSFSFHNLKGRDGRDGADGAPGRDGATGTDGAPGEPGEDGFSPTVSIDKVGKTTTITITDKNGPHEAKILDGADGAGGGGSAYTLPVAAAGTLGGVKAKAKTEAETEEVAVDEDGKLWVKPAASSGDGSESVEVLVDITLTEDQILPGQVPDQLIYRDIGILTGINIAGKLTVGDRVRLTIGERSRVFTVFADPQSNYPNWQSFGDPYDSTSDINQVIYGFSCPVNISDSDTFIFGLQLPVEEGRDKFYDTFGVHWDKAELTGKHVKLEKLARDALPVASEDTLGGVRGPAKTNKETVQVHVDEDGNMWVAPPETHIVDIGTGTFDPTKLDFAQYKPGDVVMVVADSAQVQGVSIT